MNGQISEYFSDYRAEWPLPYFASLFVRPPYFTKLQALRPCLLIGGRGTGKTTALKSLRFDAVGAATPGDSTASTSYLGIYIRMNKNRVRAFVNSELPEPVALKAFAHYFNILACQELCRLAAWLSSKDQPKVQADCLALISKAFGLPESVGSIDELLKTLNQSVVQLEFWINNGGRGETPSLSIAEAPVRYLAEALQQCGALGSRQIFCCIDEYENLSAGQQALLNAYLKHSEPPLSYKIGLRRGGLLTRNTIDGGDQIATPDDYVEIDIKEEEFERFAVEVINHRLTQARKTGISVGEARQFLPELPFDEEAQALGCERISNEVTDVISKACPALLDWAATIPSTRLYFLKYWSDSGNGDICALAHDWQSNSATWDTRIGNYGYASLFWLSKGRKGARIRKYYAGLDTFVALASGNIRYFLELVDFAISEQLKDLDHGAAEIYLSPKAQTLAARAVAKRRLDQLEGLSERGVELKRLVLAIGKVFFELARDPAGRSPEQNSFVLSGGGASKERVAALLNDGVAHLAFESSPKTKLTSSSELRDEEYRLHPIYCPFFEYSHRRKRRITIDPESILKLSAEPSKAISEMVGSRAQLPVKDLPEQLAMFSDFFEG